MRANLAWMLKSAVLALFCLLLASAALREEKLTIHTEKSGPVEFTVELAVTDGERAQGLMHREEMAADRGMLFDFGVTREAFMWMKNTILPLDMLFIAEDGRIAHIQEDTEPFSEAVISSRAPVRFVLELNAGAARKWGIKPGDRVESAQISRARGTP
jgi:uncharacterized membrane protein (UPF0127 family)